jgi:hypothetical protein
MRQKNISIDKSLIFITDLLFILTNLYYNK